LLGDVHGVRVLARTATASLRGDARERRIVGVRLWAASVHDFPLVGVTRDAVLGTGRPAWSVFDLAARVSGGDAVSSTK